METLKRNSASIVAIAIIFFLVCYARASVESTMNLTSARKFLSQEKISESIDSYRRAISWSAPGLAAPHQALSELERFIDESKMNEREKFLAYNELKRGLMSSRSWLTAYNGDQVAIDRINEKISALIPEEQKRNAVTELYPPKINYGFQLLAQIGFWGWFASVITLIWRGFDRFGAPQWRKLSVSACVMLAFFLVWLVGLRWA